MVRKAAIGVQDFGKIRENGYFYVDKTFFIKDWWENGDDVTLITRPRRFGKTLAMNMVEQFFSLKYAGNGGLFDGLLIWQEEKYRALQGAYPVISLSFAGIKGESFEETYAEICDLIAREYSRCFFLLDGDCLSEPEKEAFQKIAYHKMEPNGVASAVNRLSEYLCRYYGKRVIILLDEYDTPMQEAYLNGFWDELAGFIRKMFHMAFKANPWLERALLTGITRVSKESIFSDLNNLKVVTTTSNSYETVFGFTEEEVFVALEEFGMSDSEQDVKCWYDGFRFGDYGNIYNPWSILNFLAEGRFMTYWANTSSNRLAGELVRRCGAEIKLEMEDLLNGGQIQTLIEEEIIFKQLDYKRTAIWGLLLASGYLKVVQVQWNRKGQREYVLTLTNREIRMMFDQIVMDWFSNKDMDYNQFSDALCLGNKEFMNAYINEIAEETFSSFDTGKKPSRFKPPENFYHGFVLGLIADLRNIYRITSNRESGNGRYDVLLEPFEPKEDDGIILEFKVQDVEHEKSLQDTVDAALKQILDKKYATELSAKGIPLDRIRIYGFAFRGKEVLVDGGWMADYA